MIKRIVWSSAFLSAVAASTAFAQWPPPNNSQNGLFGIPNWVWVILGLAVVAVVVVVIKKRGKK